MVWYMYTSEKDNNNNHSKKLLLDYCILSVYCIVVDLSALLIQYMIQIIYMFAKSQGLWPPYHYWLINLVGSANLSLNISLNLIFSRMACEGYPYVIKYLRIISRRGISLLLYKRILSLLAYPFINCRAHILHRCHSCLPGWFLHQQKLF